MPFLSYAHDVNRAPKTFNLGGNMMDSAMIAKISKAREYASEPERITFNDFTVLFTGKHQSYRVGFTHGG